MTINKNITSKNIDFLICELDLLSPLDPRVLQDPPLRDFSSHGFSLHGSRARKTPQPVGHPPWGPEPKVVTVGVYSRARPHHVTRKR